jgi:hypothetical protein
MPDREAKVARAIRKYGSDVVLVYRPAANDATAPYDDWPDPDATPTAPAPDPRTVKAVMVPVQDTEWTGTLPEGVMPDDAVQGFFTADEDLNTVDHITWRGGNYKLLQQDAYELQGAILVQACLLQRLSATVLFPHA